MYTKDTYEEAFEKLGERKQEVKEFNEFLKEKTKWLSAPASTKIDYHNCFDGGLLSHSVNVLNTALRLNEIYKLNEESVIICSLYHDLGKLGYPDAPYYIPLLHSDKLGWKIKYGERYRINEDIVHLEVAHRSVYLIMKYSKIDLTPEEYQAILIHDGQYVDANKRYQHKETPLAVLLHQADWSAYFFIEKKKLNILEE